MSVGIIEVGVVVAAFAVCLPLGIARGQKWLTAVPFFFLVAMLTTPADLASLVLVGVPNAILGSLIFFSAQRWNRVQA